jgi:hypothetical protein
MVPCTPYPSGTEGSGDPRSPTPYPWRVAGSRDPQSPHSLPLVSFGIWGPTVTPIPNPWQVELGSHGHPTPSPRLTAGSWVPGKWQDPGTYDHLTPNLWQPGFGHPGSPRSLPLVSCGIQGPPITHTPYPWWAAGSQAPGSRALSTALLRSAPSW